MPRAPGFWYRRPGLAGQLLWPISCLYALATKRRVSRPPDYAPPCSVISVGNINAGGTGKTPTAIAIGQRLLAEGRSPAFVTRGYGGRLEGPLQVDPNRHRAGDVGDEALLLAAFCPTFLGRDRAAAAQRAVDSGANILILDDAHQNPSIRKDLSLLTVDAVAAFGNGLVIPAGPLREPVASGLARADMLLSIGPEAAQARFDAETGGQLAEVTRLRGTLKPLAMGLPWTGRRVLAFAGIGHPEKFFATLRAEGAEIIRAESLADHQPLTPALMTRLETEAKARVAQLVTTEKDFVRLPDAFRPKVLSVPVRLELEDWAPLDQALRTLAS